LGDDALEPAPDYRRREIEIRNADLSDDDRPRFRARVGREVILGRRNERKSAELAGGSEGGAFLAPAANHRIDSPLRSLPQRSGGSDGVSIELGDLLVRSNIFTESERQAALSVFAREGSLARVDR
jgi:hypothetical protein